ncbi:MAG: hypothetical protein KDK34_05310, partial [Leptospiraceae bacterium]|nr:hypothetical protein [Leptospiraceae bacterium]
MPRRRENHRTKEVTRSNSSLNRAQSMLMKVMQPGYKTLCLLIIGLLISVQNLSAQTPPGNPRPDANMPVLMQPEPGKNYRVDLLSMETGAAVYSTWGHTALRIYDRETGRDAVFDFGL